MLTFSFAGVEGTMIQEDDLTSGMVGREVCFVFPPEWENLHKTAVYSAGKRCVIHAGVGERDTIPAEVLEKPMERLYVGIYATAEDGSLVIPTMRAEGPMIRPGVNPAWDPAAEPGLPVWAQLLSRMGDLEELRTAQKTSLVAAINSVTVSGGAGVIFFPEMSEDGVLSWSNDGGLENPDPVDLTGPQGEKGETGAAGAIPVRGVDYWTDADKAEIKSYVDTAILGGAW